MKQAQLKLFFCFLFITGAVCQYDYGGQRAVEQSSFTSMNAMPSMVKQSISNTPVMTSELTSGFSFQTSAPSVVPAANDNIGLSTNVCYNIIDSDFPLFSSYCSVLPQTTFSLPNHFSHSTKQEAHDLLNNLGAALESGCFQNLRMFVCPLLFPPCDFAPILPCAQFCRAIQSRCSGFDLSMIDCDRLPEQSEFCPIVASSRTLSVSSGSYGAGASSSRNSFRDSVFTSSCANTQGLFPDRQISLTGTLVKPSSLNQNILQQSSWGVDSTPSISQGANIGSGFVKSTSSSYGSSSSLSPSRVLSSRISMQPKSAPLQLQQSTFSGNVQINPPLTAPQTWPTSIQSPRMSVPVAPKSVSQFTRNTYGSTTLSKTLPQIPRSSYGSSSDLVTSQFQEDSFGSNARVGVPKMQETTFSANIQINPPLASQQIPVDVSRRPILSMPQTTSQFTRSFTDSKFNIGTPQLQKTTYSANIQMNPPLPLPKVDRSAYGLDASSSQRTTVDSGYGSIDSSASPLIQTNTYSSSSARSTPKLSPIQTMTSSSSSWTQNFNTPILQPPAQQTTFVSAPRSTIQFKDSSYGSIGSSASSTSNIRSSPILAPIQTSSSSSSWNQNINTPIMQPQMQQTTFTSAPRSAVQFKDSSYGSIGSSASSPLRTITSSTSNIRPSPILAPIQTSSSSWNQNINTPIIQSQMQQSTFGSAPRSAVQFKDSSYGSIGSSASSTSNIRSSPILAPIQTLSSSSWNQNINTPIIQSQMQQSTFGSAPRSAVQFKDSSYGSFDSSAPSLAEPIGSSYSSVTSNSRILPKSALTQTSVASSLNQKISTPIIRSQVQQSTFGSAPRSTTQLSDSSHGSSSRFAQAPINSYSSSSRTFSQNKFGDLSYGSIGRSVPIQSITTNVAHGAPFGIRSSGTYTSLAADQEVEFNQCTGEVTDNPCTVGGPQYFPVSSNPSCYIQCAFERMYVRACPDGLIWNTLVDTCDWPAIDETSDVTSFSDQVVTDNMANYNSLLSSAYRRKKRSVPERKKRFLPFVPPIIDPVPVKVPLGPILPGMPPPLPGLPGTLGLPFIPGLFPPLGPLVPPLFPPPLIPPVAPFPAVFPPMFPPLFPPVPPPVLPPPVLPPPVLPPPVLPPPILPPPIIPPPIMAPPFLPPMIPTIMQPIPPPLFGMFGGPLGPFGGPFDLLGLDPFFDHDFGGIFPFGDDFYGGVPGPFFDPVPYPGGYDSKRYRGSSKKSYSSGYDSDDYPSKKSYKMNGNFKNYKSKSYGGSSSSYYDDDDDSYRKKRQYGIQVDQERSLNLINNQRTPPKEPTRNITPALFFGPNNLQASRVVPTTSIQQQSGVPKRLKDDPSIQSSPCFGKMGKANIPHPTDVSKYIACLNEEKYEIMSCPTGLIYNPMLDQCEADVSSESICQRQQPCLNDGQCYQTGPSTYKCTCRGSWTGEHCETPISSCANDPCGPGNECQTLITPDLKQDYVCVCDNRESYGLTCGRNTVPNPCMAASNSIEQYYGFAFSSHAYVQCNGELIYLRPCAAGLYWNQEKKICDREQTAPLGLGEDQPASLQNSFNYNEQMKNSHQTSSSITDRNVDRQQGNRYRNYNPHLKQKDTERRYNQIFSRHDLSVDDELSFGSPSMNLNQRMIQNRPMSQVTFRSVNDQHDFDHIPANQQISEASIQQPMNFNQEQRQRLPILTRPMNNVKQRTSSYRR